MKSLHKVVTLPSPTPSGIVAEALVEIADRYSIRPEDILISCAGVDKLCLGFWMEAEKKGAIDRKIAEEYFRQREEERNK